MVTPEQLESLDLTLWLGTEQLAASRTHCNQSTISRRSLEVQRQFRVERIRNELTATWELQPTNLLLEMEREVHQLHRCLHGGRLRLEADAWLAPLLQGLPQRWIRGTLDGLGVERPLQLLRSRVIDGWLNCVSLDLPDPDDPELQVIELARLPLLLVVHPLHPLLGRAGLQPHDLARFPSLAVSDHLYPRFAAALRAHGLWSRSVALYRYDPSNWEGLTADQATIGYANPLSLRSRPMLEPLSYSLEIDSPVSLVVLRELAQLAPMAELLQHVQGRLRDLLS
jgi:hypothetical protein